ncbi:Auxin transporter-like protein 3 [Hibiscus syriacus]|uniref:Auxin transporter-like protein 3 n=1 Tax=Hibiscus syriacus TaxID=106335 RepID=A0A6A3BT46_HIBSY|nr:Auxin transporter-like protein 3 [Hibiscus syriacus]
MADASEKVVETVIVGNYVEMETEGEPNGIKSKVSKLFWHGGSVYDAWFSCASNQVAQVLLTLPYSFSQLGMLSGILFQLFYGLMGSWTAYLISILYVEYRTRKEREKVDFRNHVIQWFEVLDGLLGKHWRNVGLAFNCTFLLFGSVIQLIACASNIYYINDNLDKRTWTYIFGACCATTVFIPSFHNYRIWSFLGLIMTTYTAWYLTIASLLHGQVEGVQHSGPTRLVLYFTGATNILYTFGGHAVTVEIMHAMWKPQKFKAIYLIATVFVLTLTLPSAAAVYWAFGDMLLNHSNAFSLLPRTHFRDMAFITFGFACTPLYFVWEKAIGMHERKSLCKRAAARLPVVVPIWFLAIIFPFFGPINSTVGSLLVSFTVYIIPALAHIFTFRSATAREVLSPKPQSSANLRQHAIVLQKGTRFVLQYVYVRTDSPYLRNAVEQPSKYFGRWVGAYTINMFVVVWVLIVGFGFGGWASMTNFIHQIDTFGLFTKCYQCPPPASAASRPSPLHGLNATAAAPMHHPFNHTHMP